ncbi:MAG: MFS transporter [Bacteroidota bacterium]
MNKERLSKWTLTAYAGPVVATSIMHMPSIYIIPAFYAKYTDISLAAIATVLLFGRVFDAVSDPLTGFLSDRTRSRFGKRKPWMLFGTPIAMVAIIFVFMPPASAGIFYFAFWSIAMFLSWTLIDVPQLAWGSELSHDYNERSRIMTSRVVAMNIGSVLFMATPILLLPYTGTTEIGPLVMKVAGWSVALSLPVFMFFTLRYVPVGKQVSTHIVNLWDFVKSAKVNKPFVRFTFATIFDWIGIGIWLGTFYIFTDTYMGVGDKFPYLLMAAWLTRALTAPVWVRLMKRFGKHKVWAVSTFLDVIIIPLALFIEPGASAFVPMMAYILVLGFIQSGTAYAPPAIYGDVVDYDTLKTGSNKAGSFFAIYGLITKAALAIGGSIAFYLMSAFDFDVSGGNSDHQNLGLFLAYAFVPPVTRIVTMLAMWNFPINERRQGIIKRRIESRSESQPA